MVVIIMLMKYLMVNIWRQDEGRTSKIVVEKTRKRNNEEEWSLVKARKIQKMVFHDLAATNEELEQEVVKEAMRFAPSGYCHWRESIHDLDSLHEEHLQLVAKNKELENMISTLEEELLTLKQAIQRSERNNLSQDEGRRSVEGELEGDYMDMEGPTVDFVSKGFTEEIVTEPDLEESKKHEGSNIYTRLKRATKEACA
ncbi:hypothetical protein SESBI_08767 [Sesbania bispinosa]|nr:hypothetical protein SESBI_08767 [Sesbania bispinosa]